MSDRQSNEISSVSADSDQSIVDTRCDICDTYSSLIDSERKNAKSLHCEHCDCLILRPNIAFFIHIQKSLPSMTLNANDVNSAEMISHFWLVNDMFQFENMAFSKSVANIKYLACAECEIGPIGVFDVNDDKCYVALQRVHHKS